MRKTLKLFLFMLLFSNQIVAQGFYNHQWLLGSYLFFQDPKGRIVFDSSSYTHIPEFRKMVFNGTEATICDAQGDFLMSSNGIWIANTNNDTMMNGSGLNPGLYADSWSFGMPLTYNNIFLPFPSDTNLYALFHHSFNFDGNSYVANEIFNSIIDISLDNGLGGVTIKNNLVFSDTLNQGFAACKHANGRDWWVVCQKHNTDIIYNILLTPWGIDTVFKQQLNVPIARYNVTQLTFSPDGNKFAYFRYQPNILDESVIILDFDRCTGIFSSPFVVPVTLNQFLWGLAFSPSGDFIYTCSSINIFQINTSSLTVDTVATYDGFISPPNLSCCATSFWNMYLAPNGKIYITSGSGVQHLHEMNFPDSAGLACDVQQHAINLGYAQLRAVPNHPNYNLGPVIGSACDTLSVGIEEHAYDFHFGIFPNPSESSYVKFVYLLPQNKSGELSLYSIMGQLVHKQYLSPWSSLQLIDLSNMSAGIYTCVLTSGMHRTAKKLVVIGGSGGK